MSKYILSINGNKAMNYLLQTISKRKFDFVAVRDVFSGMSYLKSKKNIGLILIDIDYEAEQGWAMINHIKTSRLYELPVFILTSYNNEEFQKKCLHYGIEDIFLKPFNPIEIVNACSSSLYANVNSSYANI